MKIKLFVMLLIMAVAALPVLSGCAEEPAAPTNDNGAPTAQPDEVFEWQAQGIYTPGDPGLEVQQAFVDRVYELSAGRLDITLQPIGAVVDPMETFDAVADGVLEVGMKTPMWWPGKEPVCNLLTSLPGSFTHAYQLDAWYWEHGGIDIAREAYGNHGIYFVGPAIFGVPPIGAEIVHSHEPIYSIDDYDGLKVRSGGAAAHWFEGLGASIVNLPGPEIYPALERGVVDAAEWVSPNSNWALGLHEAADYVITPGMHTLLMASEVTVNMDDWESLPPDLQAIMEVATKELSVMKAQRFEDLDHEFLQRMADDYVEVIEWEDEEIQRATEYAQTLWDDFATDDLSEQALESQREYMRKIGIID